MCKEDDVTLKYTTAYTALEQCMIEYKDEGLTVHSIFDSNWKVTMASKINRIMMRPK